MVGRSRAYQDFKDNSCPLKQPSLCFLKRQKKFFLKDTVQVTAITCLLIAGYIIKSLTENLSILTSVKSNFKFLMPEIGILFHLHAVVKTLMASSFFPFAKGPFKYYVIKWVG